MKTIFNFSLSTWDRFRIAFTIATAVITLITIFADNAFADPRRNKAGDNDKQNSKDQESPRREQTNSNQHPENRGSDTHQDVSANRRFGGESVGLDSGVLPGDLPSTSSREPSTATRRDNQGDHLDLSALDDLRETVEGEANQTPSPIRIPVGDGFVSLNPKAIPGLSDLTRSRRDEVKRHIGEKIERGRQLLAQIRAEATLLSPSKTDVADLMWALQVMAEQKVGPFKKGAITIPDPGNRIRAYLDRNSEREGREIYLRNSSHLPKEQSKPGGRPRGMDFYNGTAGFPQHLLPYGFKTVLMQSVRPGGGERRLFLKMETEGARIRIGIGGDIQSRRIRRSDWWNTARHVMHLVEPRTDDGMRAFREKMPASIKELRASAIEAARSDQVKKALTKGENHIYQIVANIRDLESSPNYVNLDGEFRARMQALSDAIAERYEERDWNRRYGGEVVLHPDDLTIRD